jgi:hypothetical protein
LVRGLMLDAVRPGSGGGAGFPDAGFRVLDQAELDRVRTVVIDAVAVEQVGVGEGAVTGRAMRAVDAVPAVSAAGAADRQPTRLVPGHFGRLRPAEPCGARVLEDGQSCCAGCASGEDTRLLRNARLIENRSYSNAP